MNKNQKEKKFIYFIICSFPILKSHSGSTMGTLVILQIRGLRSMGSGGGGWGWVVSGSAKP